jgi:Ca2+-binding EF-hand superfamily protein
MRIFEVTKTTIVITRIEAKDFAEAFKKVDAKEGKIIDTNEFANIREIYE